MVGARSKCLSCGECAADFSVKNAPERKKVCKRFGENVPSPPRTTEFAEIFVFKSFEHETETGWLRYGMMGGERREAVKGKFSIYYHTTSRAHLRYPDREKHDSVCRDVEQLSCLFNPLSVHKRLFSGDWT
ncbi:hypothetical protein Ddc_02504 [Ditylenchus destructor]|nr:hypothetical protein Ddc_02504 [Ditylenchus destructor]